MWRQLERKRNGSFMSTSASNARKKRRLFCSSAQNDENAGSETISDSSLLCEKRHNARQGSCQVVELLN